MSHKTEPSIYQLVYIPGLNYNHELWVVIERVRSYKLPEEVSSVGRQGLPSESLGRLPPWPNTEWADADGWSYPFTIWSTSPDTVSGHLSPSPLLRVEASV